MARKDAEKEHIKNFQELKRKYRRSTQENSLYSNKMIFDSPRNYIESVKKVWGKK